MSFSDKLLIVDDDIQLANMLVRFMKSQGKTCKVVYDSKAALEELLTHSYDICLLDVNMPGLSGMEVLSDVRKRDVLTAIIMMTGNEETQHIISALRSGADDYLRKPFELEELELSLQRASMLNHLRQTNKRYKDNLEAEVKKKTEQVRKSYYDIIQAFSKSIEFKDKYTGGHNRRVSRISRLFGEALGFPEDKLVEIEYGGLLHDIGKIGISDSILNKEGKLTDSEFSQIKQHPFIGSVILKDFESVSPFIPYVLYHHERFDGRGYPEMLHGESIPLEGRIVSIADALDAMTSTRSYRKPFTDQQAYDEILACEGKQFDPFLVSLYKDLWKAGSLQQLLRV